MEANLKLESNPNFEILRSEILDLHKVLINAHLDKDVSFFVQNLSRNYLSVSAGEIRTPSIEEIRSSVSDYLNQTTFTEYKDLCEPIIGFSKDGSLAWSIVQVKVAGKRTMSDGSDRDLDFICAWITLFERQGNQWIRLAEVSSFK